MDYRIEDYPTQGLIARLEHLARLCESATEASHTLDALIMFAIRCPAAPVELRDNGNAFLWGFQYVEVQKQCWLHPTHSIDDAFKLTEWIVVHMSDISADGLFEVILTDTVILQDVKSQCARTRALGITAAALRARAFDERISLAYHARHK